MHDRYTKTVTECREWSFYSCSCACWLLPKYDTYLHPCSIVQINCYVLETFPRSRQSLMQLVWLKARQLGLASLQIQLPQSCLYMQDRGSWIRKWNEESLRQGRDGKGDQQPNINVSKQVNTSHSQSVCTRARQAGVQERCKVKDEGIYIKAYLEPS